MGRGRGKGKNKFTLTNNDDTGSGEEERIPAQKRRGRPQKPLVDEIEEDVEKIEEDEENPNANDIVISNKDATKVMENGKKRKRNKQLKEEGEGDSVKEESGIGSKSNGNGLVQVNGFRHTGSRRKSKPRRAAEAGVECK